MQTGQFAPAVDIAGGDARFSIAGLSRRSSWVTLAVTQSPPQRDGTRPRQATLDSAKRTGHGEGSRTGTVRELWSRTCTARGKHRPRCLLCTRTGHGVSRQPVRHMWRQLAHRHRTRCSLRTMHGARRTHAAGRDGGRMCRCGLVAVSGRCTAATGHVARSSRLRPVPVRPRSRGGRGTRRCRTPRVRGAGAPSEPRPAGPRPWPNAVRGSGGWSRNGAAPD